jgi:hypothetical protein
VLDREARFRKAVIEDFADAYARGETPVPCIRCNQTVKFQDLVELAKDLGAEALATGHYVRRVEGPDGPELRQAVDPARDQSYFLFATTPEQLAFSHFPLGGYASKAEVRAEAARLGLDVAAKADSQDICFVPRGNYHEVVAGIRPEAALPGSIEHVDGRVLGTHQGIARYTVGQGRGLGQASRDGDDPLYVAALDAPQPRLLHSLHERRAKAFSPPCRYLLLLAVLGKGVEDLWQAVATADARPKDAETRSPKRRAITVTTLERHKNTIRHALAEHPDWTRLDFFRHVRAAYSAVTKDDLAWWDAHAPAPNRVIRRIDYGLRDRQQAQQVRAAGNRLQVLKGINVAITKRMILREAMLPPGLKPTPQLSPLTLEALSSLVMARGTKRDRSRNLASKPIAEMAR